MMNVQKLFKLKRSVNINNRYESKSIHYLRTGKLPKVKRKPFRVPKPDELKSNVGINNRLRTFVEHNELVEEEITEEDMESLEPDVMRANKVYQEHWDELTEIDKRKHGFNIIRKHFKQPKQPNMLTYAEKEQIRLLNQEDPDIWTPDKLSESFPATPEIVKKILGANWKAKDAQNIMRHDKSVANNWKMFKDNKLEVDEELRSHLSKFTNRYPIYYKEKDVEKLVTRKKMSPVLQNTSFEFSKIITSYQALSSGDISNETKNQDENEITCTTPPPKMIDETKKSILKDEHYTLDKLREKIKNNEIKTEIDLMILESTPKEKLAKIEQTQKEYVGIESYANNRNILQSDDYKLYLLDTDHYPLHIDIPDEQWKKGAIYKVKDCFYNDAGNFIYRVPGLVS